MTRSKNDLDSLIDTALRRDAALEPAPFTLRRGVLRRVHYAKLRDQEARRFRTALLLFSGCAAASFAAVAGAAVYAMGHPVLRPGLGGLEYQFARWISVWGDVRGEVMLFGGAAVVAVLIVAAGLPLGKRLLNN